MRYLMIVGLIFLHVCNIKSQDFAPLGAKWYFTEGFAFSGNIGFFELSVEKDTLIKGIDCKMIVKNKTQECSTRPLIEYMYENDSNEVYFFDREIDDFQKLWDFNPVENESWSVKINATDTLITYLVDSISQIEINGQNLKQIFVTYKFHQNGYEYFYSNSSIIENIGDMSYFFPWNSGVCDMNYAEGLRCYHDSQIGEYSTGITESCNYTYTWTNINDIRLNNSVMAFPNPTKGEFEIKNIKEDYKNLRFSIFDTSGKLLISRQMKPDRKIDIRGLDNGFYHMILYEGKDMIGTTEILKN